PDASLLVKAVHYGADPQMPPKGKLPADQVAAITTWVKQGAPWPETGAQVRPATATTEFKITDKDRSFWSFQPVGDPPLPPVRDAVWPRTSLDFFVLARQEAAGLKSVGPADRPALIRRATFDLIGLPPTPEEIDAFVNDPLPGAF